MHDFGFVSLDLKHATLQDTGTYTCRAWNKHGEAVTSAKLMVCSEKSEFAPNFGVIQLEEGLGRAKVRKPDEVVAMAPPVFVKELTGKRDVPEYCCAHFEGRVEPFPCDNMVFTWDKDGVELPVGE